MLSIYLDVEVKWQAAEKIEDLSACGFANMLSAIEEGS